MGYHHHMSNKYAIRNEDFLRACFGADWMDAHVAGFREDPASLETLGLKHYWGGWRAGDRMPDTTGNTYFTISLFDRDPADGRPKRRKALFRATHVIVVDDVGTKVTNATAANLPPASWSLETSPGNFQWGYILTTPETDAARVNALLDGMIAKGLAADGRDPGMKGVTRYVRLPEGRNTKRTALDWSCVLGRWEPSLTYTMDELARPWGIDLPVAGTTVAPGSPGSKAALGRGAGATPDDGLFEHLDRWGLVDGTRAADGLGWNITCPWVDQHTDRASTGTAYWARGDFKCHHGHCEHKNYRDLANWIDDRLGLESGGLVRTPGWGFDMVVGYVKPEVFSHGAGELRVPNVSQALVTSPVPLINFGTGMVGAFFRELVYVAPEDRFYSLRTGELLSRAAVDFSWNAELAAVGFLLKGEAPSKRFADPDNTARARIADRMTYWPGVGPFFEDGGVRYANRWSAPERVGVPVTDADVEPWLRLVRHIVGGAEGQTTVDLVLDWMAGVVGCPGMKPGWHVVMQGGQGLGKDMIAQPVWAGVGRSNVGTVNAAALHSPFNPWAERRLVVVNELKQNSKGSATGADQYNVLKELTENTNTHVKINQKNMREYYARNVSAFYVTSNDDRAIALEADDRRFLVVMAKEVKPLGKDEYARLGAWMEAGGGAGLCAEWLHDRWEGMSAARRGVLTGNAPGTKGKAAMILNTEDVVVAWMRSQIEDGIWPDLMTGDDLASAFSAAAKSGVGGFGWVPGPNKWGSALRALGGGKLYGGEPVRLKSGVKARVWAVRLPHRFAGMGEPQIAQAYVSAAGSAFADDADVISITRAKDAKGVATPNEDASKTGVAEKL
jgi:hypothetical protein